MINYQLVKVAAPHQNLFCSLYSDKRQMQFIAEPLSHDQALGNFKKILRLSQQINPRSIYRVIEVTSEQVMMRAAGFVRLKKVEHSDTALIGVMLLAEFEGQGLAYQAQKKLMLEVQAMAYCQAFTAYCKLDNERAHRLYQRLGFQKVKQLLYNQQPSIQWQRGI